MKAEAGAGPASAPPVPEGRLTPADATTAAAAAAAQARSAGQAEQTRPSFVAAPPSRPPAAAAPGGPQTAAQAGAGPQIAHPPATAGTAAVPAHAPAAAGTPALRPSPPPPAHRGGLPPPAMPVRPPVGMAAPRRRHWVALITFVLAVLVPSALWGWYLWTRAADQYTSTTAFSVRREEGQTSFDILGGLSALGGSSGTASDTDILFEVIRSPDMVRRVGERIDLTEAFTRAWPRDFVFAYDPSGTHEDLTDYWNRQVKVLLDNNAGIITVRGSAFTPDDALQITSAILDESEAVVNALSDKAHEDATALAQSQLDKTRSELLAARQAMTAFRVRTRILDPEADLGSQMQILATLQGELAQQQVALDQLRENARPTDQRIIQAENRIAAIERQIEDERAKFSTSTQEGENYAQLMQDYERLAVDVEFAEGAYASARVAYEVALQNAQRQSRYLAAHIQPTAAERSLRPDRPWLFGLGVALTFILWSIAMMVYYSIRDRR